MEKSDIECVIEGILFVSGEPVSAARLAAVLKMSEEMVDDACSRLRDKYSFERRGLRLVKLENSYQLCSSPEYADYIRLALETGKKPKLSQPALEALAVIAYFQPATKAYVEQIRGVDSSYTVGLLADRGLIEPCGRLAVPGRPVLYQTTPVFLRTFGLESLSELPELPPTDSKTPDRQQLESAIFELEAKELEDGTEECLF